jgi:hypothetical protein
MTDQLECEGALRLLVARLDAGFQESSDTGSGSGEAAWLVRLDNLDEQGGQLGLKPLDGHPVDVLTGFTAPDDWFAIGVVSDGWAHSLDRAPSARVARQRIRMFAVVARDGSEVSAMHRYGHDELEFLEGHGEGEVPDTLRRTLGLPTAPPAVGIDEFMAKIWLEAIVAAGRRSRHATKLSWEKAAALHPAMELVNRPVTANNLPEVAADIAGRMDWERLRRQMARDDDATGDCVAWMDAGMFARRMVGGRPPIDDLCRRASHRLTKPAATKVLETLTAWGFTTTAAAA